VNERLYEFCGEEAVDALHAETGDDIHLPPMVVPQPNLEGRLNGLPLIGSAWSWVAQTVAVNSSKAYQE
jgi:hypothetical protein